MASEIKTEEFALTGKNEQSSVAAALLADTYNAVKFADKYPTWMYETVQPLLLGLASDNNDKLDERQKNFFSPGETIAAEESSKKNEPRIDFDKVPRPGDFRGSIQIDGVEREYLLHVPPGYSGSQPIPLVVALHGLGGNASQFARESNISTLADKHNFIVVYPDARPWFGEKQLKIWDAANGLVNGNQGDNELKFLRSIIEKTQSQASIDSQRIYVTGISNGGMMTFDAAAALSDKIAAIAVVSGAMSGKEKPPSQPLSVLNIHGTDDAIIPIEGVEGVPSLLSEAGIPTLKPNWYVSNYWNAVNGNAEPSQIEFKENQVIERWTNSKSGAEVEQRIIIGGRHKLDEPAQTADAIWQFFMRHPKIASTETKTPPHDHPQDSVAEQANENSNTVLPNSQIGHLVERVQNLPDGSFNPGKLYSKLEGGLHNKLSTRCDQLIRAINTASKQGNHFELKLNQSEKIPLSTQVPALGTTVSLDDLEIGNLSFDMSKENNLVHVEHVAGLTIHGNFWGWNLSSRVDQLAEQVNREGQHFYRLQFDNPMPYVLRQVSMTPEKLSVDVRMETDGTATIMR
ncbi:MAG: hypothetical protein EKK48_07845 [Candidatus Melainabacteria bacterium]|nr:MAG: hypothetical protein EKK48_07845 [Candidatus Melainabacteria bacterium]